jgi:glycosyltransferase involved in cell wall biosynthesis
MSEKPKLVLSANAIPECGGQGVNLHHMIGTLSETFDLCLFCRAVLNQGETTVPPSILSGFVGRTRFIRRFRDWQGYWDDRQFDSYVARNLPKAAIFQGVTGQCLRSLAAARVLGARTALDCVTTHIDDFISHQVRECARFGVRPPHNALRRRSILREYDAADLIRVMSGHARETFLERGFAESRVIVAPPPMDVRRFPVAHFRNPLFRISFVGLLEPWKGFHYLIEAFQRLSRPDLELVLWGSPGSRGVSKYLSREVGRDSRLRIMPVEVRQYGYDKVYGSSSVLVHPSMTDGFGYVVAEAMCSGIPAIVTRNTGAASLIADGYNGFVVPPGDAEAIHDRLEFLADHPVRAHEMGRAARATMIVHGSHPAGESYSRRLQSLAA